MHEREWAYEPMRRGEAPRLMETWGGGAWWAIGGGGEGGRSGGETLEPFKFSFEWSHESMRPEPWRPWGHGGMSAWSYGGHGA